MARRRCSGPSERPLTHALPSWLLLLILLAPIRLDLSLCFSFVLHTTPHTTAYSFPNSTRGRKHSPAHPVLDNDVSVFRSRTPSLHSLYLTGPVTPTGPHVLSTSISALGILANNLTLSHRLCPLLNGTIKQEDGFNNAAFMGAAPTMP